MAAFGVMRAAADLGIEVPGGLSVVGFDDLPEAARVNPALTTVRQPLREMGRVAVNQLLSRLDDAGQPPARVVLDTELIVRASTAPPAG
jgi:LacI family transcriptional regulator